MYVILIIIFVILLVFLLVLYNNLIRSKQDVDQSWSDVDVQLKRRHDLIPNLVETVKGYEKYEKNLLEEVTQIRTQALAIDNTDMEQKAHVENKLTGCVKSLFALAENYPDLKANSSFLRLQQELTNTEDEIASARRIYNENAADYNIKLRQFPSNVIAGFFHFEAAKYFQSDDIQPVNVSLT